MRPNNHFLKARCKHCRGNVILQEQMHHGVMLRIIECMMCTRELQPTELLDLAGNAVSRAIQIVSPNRKSHAFQRV